MALATRREAIAAGALGAPLLIAAGPATPLSRTLSDAALRANVAQTFDRGRWRAADQRGTLNLIGAGQIRRAAMPVRSGRTIESGTGSPVNPLAIF